VYPATQKHPELPTWEFAFAPQSWHWTEAVLSANLPASHSSHSADPGFALYFPVPHAAHVSPVYVCVCQQFLHHGTQPSYGSMQPSSSLTHLREASCRHRHRSTQHLSLSRTLHSLHYIHS